MCRGKLHSHVLTPNAGSVKNYMKRLDNRISRRDAGLCRRAGFSIGSTACVDGRDKRLRPPGRPARRQSTTRVSGTDTSFPCPLRPSSERLWFIENCIELYMVTKIDNYGLQNMDRDILGACGHDAGGVELQDPIACLFCRSLRM